MCTVSWLQQEGGYQLFCNRDEKRARAKAVAPEVGSLDGVRFIAPIDPVGGGTWISTNQRGLSFCLLNGAAPPVDTHTRSIRSRGHSISKLTTALTTEEACDRMRLMPLGDFAPFTLAILDLRRQPTVVTWDGAVKSILLDCNSSIPLVSSSFDSERVLLARHQEFRRVVKISGGLRDDALLAFHGSHAAGPDAYSPCMHRPDAETVSFTHVKVTNSEIHFSYLPTAPCRQGPMRIHRLALVH